MSSSQLDSGRSRRNDRLLEALGKLAHFTDLPAGRLDRVPAVREVIDAADDLARRSELESLLDAISEASTDFTEAARCVVAAVQSRSDDRLILGQLDEDLRLLRVDFQGDKAEIPELDAVLRSTAHGSLIMSSTRRDERLSAAFAGEFQCLVSPTPETLEGFERRLGELSITREIVPYGLQGELLLTFGMGFRFRALWGSGTAIITDQRMLGVVFDDNMQGRPRSAEDGWMPMATVASDMSSVIVFDFPRSCIEEAEVLDKGFLARRVPYANLKGSAFAVACDAVRIFDAGERLVRPPKDVLGAALRSLASGTG